MFTPSSCHRGHIGGMLGGALVAWLLGPRLVRQQDPSGIVVLPGPGLVKKGKPEAETSQRSGQAVGGDRGRFVDRPPLPWLAYPEGTSFGIGGRGRALPEARGGGRALDGASGRSPPPGRESEGQGRKTTDEQDRHSVQQKESSRRRWDRGPRPTQLGEQQQDPGAESQRPD